MHFALFQTTAPAAHSFNQGFVGRLGPRVTLKL